MKYSTLKSATWNGSGILRSSKHRIWHKLYYNVVLLMLAAVSALIIILPKENAGTSSSMIHVFKRMIDIYPTTVPNKLHKHWNYSDHSFQPNVSDWDEQRTIWMEEHPDLISLEGEKPRVLMVTGSSPEPCEPSIFSHLLLRAGKNKLDYCRMHDIELFYSMGNADPEFSDWWVKLPVIRMLMLQHPEFEWIWWLDADAIVTDMSFEPPFTKLDHRNLVLYGEDHLVYLLRDWTSLNTGNFMIRNCQWSLDLLGAWASMGTASMRNESGIFQTEVLANRPLDFPGDDQSSLVILLAEDKEKPIGEQKWVPMVKLVKNTEYSMNGDWRITGPKLEELSLGMQESVPFVTHFAGCLPSCAINPEILSQRLNACVEHLERAFDFADNQVYQQYGFEPRTLGRSLEPLIRNPHHYDTLGVEENVGTPKAEEEFRMVPGVTDWDDQRRAWMEINHSTKKDEVLLVSGSTPKPCPWKAGANILLRGFKNRIDYSRKNGIKLFYNMAVLDKDMTGWWIKLPLVKMLMLSNPAVEWIWWIDSDAVFTDMDFKIPFARYNASGYNLAMYGSEHEVFEIKSYIGINSGNVLFRNCQWSLDLLDRWASLAATKELRVKNEVLLNNLLQRSPGWEADDQSVLVYLLVKEREKWASKVCLEGSYAMSGDWSYWVNMFVDDSPSDHDSPEYRPFVTHFAGCHPCSEYAEERCLVGMTRTYSYADNQVLGIYGLTHEHLNSSDIKKIKTSRVVGGDLQDTEALETKEEFKAAKEEVVDSPKEENVTPAHEIEQGTVKEKSPETNKDEEQAAQSKDELAASKGEFEVSEEENKTPAHEIEQSTVKEKSPETNKDEEQAAQSKDELAASTGEFEVPKEEHVTPVQEIEQGTVEVKLETNEEEQSAKSKDIDELATSRGEFEVPKEENVTPVQEGEQGTVKEQESVTKKRRMR